MTVKPKSVILAKDEGNKDFRIDQVCLWLGGAQEMLGLGVFGTDQVCLWLGGWGVTGDARTGSVWWCLCSPHLRVFEVPWG